MVAVGHTEMMLIGNGVTTDREDHVKIRFQHKGVLVGQRHCSMFMAISLQKITMSYKTTRAMDVTMRTMQSTSVMVNRKLAYTPKDNPNSPNFFRGKVLYCNLYFNLRFICQELRSVRVWQN